MQKKPDLPFTGTKVGKIKIYRNTGILITRIKSLQGY